MANLGVSKNVIEHVQIGQLLDGDKRENRRFFHVFDQKMMKSYPRTQKPPNFILHKESSSQYASIGKLFIEKSGPSHGFIFA